VVEHIKSRAKQLLSEWVEDDIHVDKQQNAQQYAAQPGSALPATDPPGWRSAALDHESGGPVLVSIPNRLTSPRDAIISGTAVVADESADETRIRIDTTDLSSLPVQNSVGNPKASAGSQSSPKVSAVFEPSESAQEIPKSTSTGTFVVCDALDSARCEGDTSGAKPGDIDGDQRAHAIVTSSGNKTRGTHGRAEGDEYQEAGKADEEQGEELDRIGESYQESEDEDDDDDGDDEDEEEDDHREDDDKEERGSEGEVELVSKYNDQGQKKQDDGHTVSRRRTATLTSRPTPPIGASDSDNEASDEIMEVRHNTRSSIDAAHRSAPTLSTISEPLSEHPNRAVQECRSLDARAGQKVAGLDGAQTVSARISTHGRRSNELMTESLTEMSTASGHEIADNNGSADSDGSSLSTEGELDADDDNRHTPIDEAEPAQKSSRSPKKRALTASAGAFRTPTKRHKLSDEIAGNLTSAVVKNVPSRLIQPPKLIQLIADILADTHKNSAVPLTCFFFSVASPFALRQLREACVSVRNSQRGDPATEEAGVWQSVRALDRIDMQEHVSPILRRYHLVKLVERRDQLYNEIVESVAQPWSLAPRRGLRNQTAAIKAMGTKKAAKMAFERLINEAYPEHKQEMQRSTAQYEKEFKILQNRLSNGHNWNVLQKEFGVGILALVPAGVDAGFSNTE
jgi:hypothetical protein